MDVVKAPRAEQNRGLSVCVEVQCSGNNNMYKVNHGKNLVGPSNPQIVLPSSVQEEEQVATSSELGSEQPCPSGEESINHSTDHPLLDSDLYGTYDLASMGSLQHWQNMSARRKLLRSNPYPADSSNILDSMKIKLSFNFGGGSGLRLRLGDSTGDLDLEKDKVNDLGTDFPTVNVAGSESAEINLTKSSSAPWEDEFSSRNLSPASSLHNPSGKVTWPSAVNITDISPRVITPGNITHSSRNTVTDGGLIRQHDLCAARKTSSDFQGVNSNTLAELKEKAYAGLRFTGDSPLQDAQASTSSGITSPKDSVLESESDEIKSTSCSRSESTDTTKESRGIADIYKDIVNSYVNWWEINSPDRGKANEDSYLGDSGYHGDIKLDGNHGDEELDYLDHNREVTAVRPLACDRKDINNRSISTESESNSRAKYYGISHQVNGHRNYEPVKVDTTGLGKENSGKLPNDTDHRDSTSDENAPPRITDSARHDSRDDYKDKSRDHPMILYDGHISQEPTVTNRLLDHLSSMLAIDTSLSGLKFDNFSTTKETQAIKPPDSRQIEYSASTDQNKSNSLNTNQLECCDSGVKSTQDVPSSVKFARSSSDEYPHKAEPEGGVQGSLSLLERLIRAHNINVEKNVTVNVTSVFVKSDGQETSKTHTFQNRIGEDSWCINDEGTETADQILQGTETDRQQIGYLGENSPSDLMNIEKIIKADGSTSVPSQQEMPKSSSTEDQIPHNFAQTPQFCDIDEMNAPTCGSVPPPNSEASNPVILSSLPPGEPEGNYHSLPPGGPEGDIQYYDLTLDYEIWHFQTISDKMKHYKTRLEKEEANKRQQIKILRKAQENHLQDKQLLISNLEDMVGEQEARIMQLEAQINGVSSLEGSPDNQPPVTTKTSSLVEQILNLQREKSDLTTELLQQKSESASAQNDVIEHLKTANEKLDRDKQQLQEELIKQWGAKRGSGTDTEKQLCKIEIENDQLLEDLQGSRSRAISLQAELQQCHESSRLDKVHLDRLKEENARLRSDVQSVETRYSTREDQILVIEGKLWDQIDALKTDVTKLSLENEELRKKLLAATDKPPQIITKVERVEVESQECRKELEKSQNALQECENEAQSLREEVSSWKKKYEDVDKRLQTNNNKVSALELTAAENSQLLTKVTELTTRCQDSDRQQQTDRTHITDLERQVFRYQNELSSMKSQVAEEIGILNEAKEAEIASIRAEHKAASSEQTDKLAKLRRGLADTQRALERLVEEYRKLREICLLLPDHGKLTTKQIAKQVHEAIAGVSQYNQELVRKYRKEMQLRKKYHNELVELKGNIRVFCRVRPAIKEDGQGPDSQPVVSYDPDDDGILNVLYKGRPQAFELDQVFQPSSSQEQVFDEVQALVTSCIDGYNICIFAYGQTGSGKTYTMEGPSHNPGINQRALRELFKETHERRKDWDFTISVSVLEIYNENVRDLLSSDTAKLEVKMNPEGGLHVPGLQSHVVQDINDINQIFKIGQVNRATAVTNMNEHSSRSHALLCVTIHGNNHTTGARTLGKLNLVDLAGSERVSKSGAEGARLKEAQNINKSLSTLGDVIHALRNKQTHVPYRNSKLTYLLQDSLGGDSKTLMIVQVAPVEKNVGETVASLNFAQRVRTIELGQATRRVDSSDNLNGEESGSVFKTPKASQIKMKTPRK